MLEAQPAPQEEPVIGASLAMRDPRGARPLGRETRQRIERRLGRNFLEPRCDRDAEALFALVEARQVGALVVGLPLNMDGSEGPRCQSVRQFAANLLAKREIDIAFWDERLSTAAVTRTLLEADASRKRRSELVDKLAAAYILQGALDMIKRGES